VRMGEPRAETILAIEYGSTGNEVKESRQSSAFPVSWSQVLESGRRDAIRESQGSTHLDMVNVSHATVSFEALLL
jgi:hypothetical protein